MSPVFLPLMDFGSLPFFVGPKSSPHNGELPNVMPFRLGVRTDCNLLVQLPESEVSASLGRAYELGSLVGNPMSDSGVGRKYAEDFLKFVGRRKECRRLGENRVLEIGCGYGYLLYRLKSQGFEVIGIEPGPQGQEAPGKYGVEIIRDTFPLKCNRLDNERFDMIVHCNVLEHVEEPVCFLRQQAEHLTDVGVVIFSVPNCSEYISAGDISMFLHEHWSYFTPSSLRSVVEKADLRLIHVEKAGYGGAMYGVAARSGSPAGLTADVDCQTGFIDKVQKSLEKAILYFQEIAGRNLSMGIFAPGRAINLLHLVKPNMRLRFFDDDESLHGKYLPPFNIRVEPRSCLIENPVEILLIMSRTFAEEIRKGLRNHIRLKDMRIVLFSRLMED